MQKESSLAAIFEDGWLKELRVGRDLEEAAALRRHGGDEVGARLLRRQSHLRSIEEKARGSSRFDLQTCIQGPEGPCSLPRAPFDFG